MLGYVEFDTSRLPSFFFTTISCCSPHTLRMVGVAPKLFGACGLGHSWGSTGKLFLVGFSAGWQSPPPPPYLRGARKLFPAGDGSLTGKRFPVSFLVRWQSPPNLSACCVRRLMPGTPANFERRWGCWARKLFLAGNGSSTGTRFPVRCLVRWQTPPPHTWGG